MSAMTYIQNVLAKMEELALTVMEVIHANAKMDGQAKIVTKRSISARLPRNMKWEKNMSLAAIVLGRHPTQNVGESANMITIVVAYTNGATLTTASVHILSISRRIAKKSGGPTRTTTKSVQKNLEENITAMSVRVEAMAAMTANVGVLAIIGHHRQVVNQDGAM